MDSSLASRPLLSSSKALRLSHRLGALSFWISRKFEGPPSLCPNGGVASMSTSSSFSRFFNSLQTFAIVDAEMPEMVDPLCWSKSIQAFGSAGPLRSRLKAFCCCKGSQSPEDAAPEADSLLG